MDSRYIFDLDAWKNKTDIDAKEWVESNFPEKHYGDEILMYEGWGLRALLEQAYMAGKEFVEPTESGSEGDGRKLGPWECSQCFSRIGVLEVMKVNKGDREYIVCKHCFDEFINKMEVKGQTLSDETNFNFVTAIGWIIMTIGAFLGCVAWL